MHQLTILSFLLLKTWFKKKITELKKPTSRSNPNRDLYYDYSHHSLSKGYYLFYPCYLETMSRYIAVYRQCQSLITLGTILSLFLPSPAEFFFHICLSYHLNRLVCVYVWSPFDPSSICGFDSSVASSARFSK
jgi:hypothetical protein